MKLKVKPVPGWQRAYRWFSVQAMGLAASIVSAWALVPEDWRAHVPPEWIKGLLVVVLVLGILGRLVAQDSKEGGDGQP